MICSGRTGADGGATPIAVTAVSLGPATWKAPAEKCTINESALRYVPLLECVQQFGVVVSHGAVSQTAIASPILDQGIACDRCGRASQRAGVHISDVANQIREMMVMAVEVEKRDVGSG